jgi:acyl-[acyl-carrier-protein]-phospholipid O-acyltransferase/long-chain-fatty-acid--[acyl-carrier-protein] ligase
LCGSFGATFTLWLPLLRQVGLVTVPSPFEAGKVGAAALTGGATILLGPPSFLQACAETVTSEQFAGIRLVVTGAASLPRELREFYQEKYQLAVMAGYGLTETSPVLSVNVPDPITGPGADSPQKGHVAGSVGRLLPGVAYQLVDPASGEVLPPGQTGLLQVRGANVFPGYLHDPARTSALLVDGWFNTGDLARVDPEGFLYIEGRA